MEMEKRINSQEQEEDVIDLIDNLKPDGLDSDSVPSSMRLVDNQTLEVTYWNGEVIYVDLSNYIRLG